MLIDKFLENLNGLVKGVTGPFGFFSLIYLIVKITGFRIKKKLKPLSEMLNAEIKSSFFGGTYIFGGIYLRILNYGPEIRLKLTLGVESPPNLSLELLAPVGFNFSIVKRQVINQIFPRLGSEVKLGDAKLDEEYLIRSDKPEEASSYLLYSKRIDAVKYFFENDFTEIKADSKGIYVSKISYNELDLSYDKVVTYLDKLISFSRM